ncbi:hypothetical protein PV620_30230 [Streptomyces sp. ME02-6978a]|uniref:hypothetical protein n=1 Tax=unclassified Streptomyces TaxID=2593676 RepID=UPI0029B58D65|nr:MULTISPECIES: hypothetical protein [unclassified Streptomyces]MDX3087184.1 hypothetical protein [Streptomyces sp. ME12-02E]MDX3335826.1 hypothetical protein [Streptomyces sp. ME02-6978a]
MLKNTRTRMLAAVLGEPGWVHPYSDPFTCYSDGGDSDGGQGDGSDGGDDGGDDGDGGDADGDDDGDQDAGKDDDQDDAKLGEKGVKALRELRRENRRLKAQLRQQGTDDGGSRKKSAKDDGQGDTDPEAIRERAREEARAEVWAERVEAAAIAAAAGRLANPSRVAQLLNDDLADVPKDAKGRPDKEAISELIDDLLDTDPYLAAPATGDKGRRFQGDADSGARKKTKKSAASLGEAVAARLAGKTG